MIVGDNHFECNCVPRLGPPHCHGCSEVMDKEIPWEERLCA